jgi:hypothetical protein
MRDNNPVPKTLVTLNLFQGLGLPMLKTKMLKQVQHDDLKAAQ